MTCRHGKYDPACGSYGANVRALKADYERMFPLALPAQATPDADALTYARSKGRK